MAANKRKKQKIVAALVYDVGGTHVKFLATGKRRMRKISSGRKLTPQQMVDSVLQLTQDWQYDVVSIGIPAPLIHDKILHDPVNLGKGWAGFDFEATFSKPVKIINDGMN